MKFFMLLLFLIITLKSIVVYSQSTGNPSCSSDSSCVNLNGILSPCGGALGPPPANVSSLIYGVNSATLASCLCSQDAYDSLSSCISCYANGNNNIRVANFTDYQRSCKNFDYPFGKPLKDDSPPQTSTADIIKKVLVGVFLLLIVLLIGGLIWYLHKRKVKRDAEKEADKAAAINPKRMSTSTTATATTIQDRRQSSSGSESNYSSSTEGLIRSDGKCSPTSPTTQIHKGLFPAPGVIQQPFPPTSSPLQSRGVPLYNNYPSLRYSSPPTPTSYLPPRPPPQSQPPQPPQPQQRFSRPPPARNSYQQSYYNPVIINPPVPRPSPPHY